MIFKSSVLKLFVCLYCCFVKMGVMGGNCCGLARYQTVITLGEPDAKYAKYTQYVRYQQKDVHKIFLIYSLPDIAYRFKVMFCRDWFDSGRCSTFHDKHRQHMDPVRKGHTFRIFWKKKHENHISSMLGS